MGAVLLHESGVADRVAPDGYSEAATNAGRNRYQRRQSPYQSICTLWFCIKEFYGNYQLTRQVENTAPRGQKMAQNVATGGVTNGAGYRIILHHLRPVMSAERDIYTTPLPLSRTWHPRPTAPRHPLRLLHWCPYSHLVAIHGLPQ